MRGHTLSRKLKSIVKFFKTRTIFSKSSMPASGTLIADDLMTRPQAVTCLSTDDAVNRDEAEPQAHRRTSLDQIPLPSATDDESDVSNKSSEDSRECHIDPDMDVCVRMSDSAHIASNHALNSAESQMTPQFSCLSSQEAPTVDNASCTPASRTKNELETAELDPFDEQATVLKRSRHFERLSMLCDAPRVIIDVVEERCDGYAVLQQYRGEQYRVGDPRNSNIVLDSLDPSIAPHIVITPPKEDADLVEISENNRAGMQFFPFLAVPPFFGLTCRMHTYEEYIRDFHPTYYYQQMYYPQLEPTSTRYWRVGPFESVSQVADWEGFVRELNRVWIKKTRELVAIAASSKASAFRARYDAPDFVESIGWKDPADTIFTQIGRKRFSTRDMVIIKSDSPMTVPHIIIDLAPPNDPWASYAYPVASNDQDHAFLIAIPTYEAIQNARGYEEPGADWDSSTDAFSDSSSVGPRTPGELQRVGSGFFTGPGDDMEEDDITSSYRGYSEYRIADSREGGEDCYDTSSARPATPVAKFFVGEQVDWDTLPDSLPDMETDSWFVTTPLEKAGL